MCMPDHVDELETGEDDTSEARIGNIMKIVDKLVIVGKGNGHNGNGHHGGVAGTLLAAHKTKDKIGVSKMQYQCLQYEIEREEGAMHKAMRARQT